MATVMAKEQQWPCTIIQPMSKTAAAAFLSRADNSSAANYSIPVESASSSTLNVSTVIAPVVVDNGNRTTLQRSQAYLASSAPYSGSPNFLSLYNAGLTLQCSCPTSKNTIGIHQNAPVGVGAKVPTVENLTQGLQMGQLSERKRCAKQPIPEDKKDDRYYERRRRNNEAAQRSRCNRRLREGNLALRNMVLEQENAYLRSQLQSLRDELDLLRGMILPTGCIINNGT